MIIVSMVSTFNNSSIYEWSVNLTLPLSRRIDVSSFLRRKSLEFWKSLILKTNPEETTFTTKL